MKTNIVCRTEKQTTNYPQNCFNVDVIDEEDQNGVTFFRGRKHIQIILQEDGTVSCFWNVGNDVDKLEFIMSIPYDKFFDFMLPVLKKMKKKFWK